MTNHKIRYKPDGNSKKGCFERCAKYAVWCVREKFAPLYMYKEKKDKKDSTAKRRRNLQGLKFDPSINLRKNQKKTIDPRTDPQSNKANPSTTTEVTPVQNKKRRSETDIKNDFQDMIIQTLRSFFLASPGSCISSVDEFNNVRTIVFVLYLTLLLKFFFSDCWLSE